MASWLDATTNEAREAGVRYVAAETPVNGLQRPFIEETRVLQRLENHVLLIESAILRGLRGRMPIVLVDTHRGRRVAVDLVPEKMDERLIARERTHAILAGGDVDALIVFRGKDVVHKPDDCICLLARLEHTLFSAVGFEHARVNANPMSRTYELNRNGTTFVPVPWITDEGEDAIRSIRVTRRKSAYPRRLAA